MKKVLVTMFMALAIAFAGVAQKITLKSGNLSFLKSQKEIKVVFDYSNLGVGNFESENDYIAKKVDEYNAKEAGKGDKWKESWFADRDARYKPKFYELANKYLEPKGLKLADEAASGYTMELHTVFIEPGFNVGVMRRPAFINVTVTFKDASGASLAVIDLMNCPGQDAMGFDYDTGWRISEAYAKLGKSLAGYMIKNGLK